MEKYLKSTGIADTAYFGPEAEFFVFDSIRFDAQVNAAFYEIDSIEGRWNTGRQEPGGNLGYKPPYKGGYFPVSPTDPGALVPRRPPLPGDLTHALGVLRATRRKSSNPAQCPPDSSREPALTRAAARRLPPRCDEQGILS
jgi:glutamine synthetase